MSITSAQYQAWLKADNARRALLVEVTGYDPVPPTGPGTLEATTNLVPNPVTLSTHNLGFAGLGAAEITDLGSTIANGEVYLIAKRNGVIGSDFRTQHSSYNMTVDKTKDYVITTEIKIIQKASAVDFYLQGAAVNGYGDAQYRFGQITTGGVAVSFGAAVLLSDESLPDGYRRITIKIPAALWNGTGITCRIFISIGFRTVGTYEYYYRRPQMEQKPYATAFVDGIRPEQCYPVTKYLSNRPYVSKPSDTPPNQPYDDSVLSVPQFTARLSDALEGYTVPSWGDIIAGNPEFDKDIWLTYAWDGRQVRLLLGDVTWPRSDFRPILTGTIDAMTAPDGATVKWGIKDKQWLLNAPVQQQLLGEPVLIDGTTYRVSDTAVNSIDKVWDNGVLLIPGDDYTTDLAAGTFTLAEPAVGRVTAEYGSDNSSVGAVIPLCYGPVFNITPLLVNPFILKFQVHEGPIRAITAVREDGIPVAFTANLAEGTFTLDNGTAGGVITADVEGATFGGLLESTTGHIMRRILLRRLTLADINTASLAAFIRSCPQTVGIFISERRNTIDVLDELVRSVGGFYTPGRDGRMLFGRLDPPAGTPDIYLTEDDVVHNGFRLTQQTIPWATAKLAHSRNYTVQTRLAGAVSAADRARYTAPHQTVSRNNEAVKTAHLLALEPTAKQTALMDAAEAAVETERQLALWGTTRRTWELDCRIAPLTMALGATIHLTHSRYGFAEGGLLKLIGCRENIINTGVTLTLWG